MLSASLLIMDWIEDVADADYGDFGDTALKDSIIYLCLW
jgi:hypothetical protein